MNEFSKRLRYIVAKLIYFKDRKNTAQKLKETHDWVNEQFPLEIENRRKKLYPVKRQAKKDKKNHVNLVRNTLFIDGEKCNTPLESTSSIPSYASRVDQPEGGATSTSTDSGNRRENKGACNGSTHDHNRR